MSHFKSNLRDLHFNLFEVYRTQDHYGREPFASMDEETARQLIAEVDRLARSEWGDSFAEADRDPPTFHDGTVTLPDGVKRSLDAFYDRGWERLWLPEHLGGVGVPLTLKWACSELLLGANPSAYFYASGASTAAAIDRFGTPEQRDRYVQPMIDRRWTSTMVLTEPDAGSDVGAGTTSATHVQGDLWHLHGVKRFITSGEHDWAENIVHLVLARPEGAEPGTKGLSLFIVPKFLVNDDGSPGARNGVRCARIEHKMGIKASATCELVLGDDTPCVGELLGGVHDGIRQMFHLIEGARLVVGAKAAATLSTGYLNALAYAKERVQGPDLTRMTDKTAPRVPIISHPDVRRMLMLQKAHAEGLRALVLYVACLQDQQRLEPDVEEWARREDLLQPLVKGYASEKSYELLALSMQVLGGSGYTQDYPIEQYIRDAKIDTLYEGTTGIQALDLFFRKIARDQGETLSWLFGQVRDFVKAGADADPFSEEREALGRALQEAEGQVGALEGYLDEARREPTAVYKVGLNTNWLLESLAELVIGWLLLWHAEVAQAALDGSGTSSPAHSGDRAFHSGKIASGRFWARHVLPKIALRRQIAETTDQSLMLLDEAAF